MNIKIQEKSIIKAAQEGMDAFLDLFVRSTLDAIGGELNEKTMPLLNADQITLLAYHYLREEVMEGGFVQLIHNGYGPFIFLNPFAKALNLWGAREMRNLIYDGRRLFEQHRDQICREMTDEEFMQLYEQLPAFDDLDDEFIILEEETTAIVARYIDEHITDFCTIEKE